MDTVSRLAAASGENPEDIDFFLTHATDDFIAIFYPPGREECAANALECVGERLANPVVEEDSIDLDGGSATLTLNSADANFVVGLVREDEVWKADSLSPASVELPEGVDRVALGLVDSDSSSKPTPTRSGAVRSRSQSRTAASRCTKSFLAG